MVMRVIGVTRTLYKDKVMLTTYETKQKREVSRIFIVQKQRIKATKNYTIIQKIILIYMYGLTIRDRCTLVLKTSPHHL